MKKEKKWMTLNAHGKFCLKVYICAISTNDILTSQLDYLHKKGLTDYKDKFTDAEKRIPRSVDCLTDIGIETVKHYFPGFIKN